MKLANLVLVKGVRHKGSWWFRLLGYWYGLSWADHRIVRPLFSERYGYRKGLHVGSWCFMLLRPEKWKPG